MKRVLIVEDEADIAEIVKAYLEKDGWLAETAANGFEALIKFDYSRPDLVILDLRLGDISGEQVCRKIRERSDVPIMMLTSKSLEKDRIDGLYLGADDYMIKPFSPKEVVARAHALYRRTVKEMKPSAVASYDEGRIKIYRDKLEIEVEGKPITLTATEHKLLLVLSDHADKTFSRADLLYEVRGYRFYSDNRIIDVHVKNLRKKIERDSKNPTCIVTDIGNGYRFCCRKDG